MIEIECTAPVFQTDDGDAWHWAALDDELTEVVDRFSGGPKGGWGSIKVEARVGSTQWRTSLFLSDDGSYLLPLKKLVRDAESIEAGDEIELMIRL